MANDSQTDREIYLSLPPVPEVRRELRQAVERVQTLRKMLEVCERVQEEKPRQQQGSKP